MTYVRIRSWHVLRTWTRVYGQFITRCGKRGNGQSVGELPLGEKSCETCLRLTVHDQ